MDAERRACRRLGQHRSTQRKVPQGRAHGQRLSNDIIELAGPYGRYGYRMRTGLLNNAGWRVSHKRGERIGRREGLKVPHEQKKERRLWLKRKGPWTQWVRVSPQNGSCVGLRPERPDHALAYDFVQDRTADGRVYRRLNIIDEWTREAPMIRVDRTRNSTDVLDALTDLFPPHATRSGLSGRTPAHVRNDGLIWHRVIVMRKRFSAFGCAVSSAFWSTTGHAHDKHRVRFCGSHRP